LLLWTLFKRWWRTRDYARLCVPLASLPGGYRDSYRFGVIVLLALKLAR
jgi:hypothetical protein